ELPRVDGRWTSATRAQEVAITADVAALTTTFTEQVDRLVALGYPTYAGLDEAVFRESLEPLRDKADALPKEGSPSAVPWVLVVTRDLVVPEDAVPLLRLWGPRGLGSKPGVVDRNHGEGDLAGYHPIDVSTPPASAYLLVDVERGEEFCNVR